MAYDDVEAEVKLEEETLEEDSPNNITPSKSQASFQGRLDLSSYAFSPRTLIKDEDSPSNPSKRRVQNAASSSKDTKSPLKRSSSSQNLLFPSPTPKRKKSPRKPSSYAPPSTYAHLNELQDILAPNLILLFIGLNPGLTTSRQGHAYSHHTNRFWSLLHSSGITSRRLAPEEDVTLPRDWSCGNTNIVARPTRNGAELSRGEMDGCVGVLLGKVARWRPEAVCVVGKSIWESIYRVQKKRRLGKEFVYGWQEGQRLGVEEEGVDEEDGSRIEGWEGARVFVASEWFVSYWKWYTDV